MGRAFILSPRVSDRATLFASEAVGAAPISNVQTGRPRQVWRSTTATPYVEFNLPSSEFTVTPILNTLALGFSNCGPTDTFTLKMATNRADLASSPAAQVDFDASLDDVDGLFRFKHRVVTFDNLQYRWGRIEFQFTDYVQMGRLIFGKRIEPACGIVSGWTPGFDEAVAETMDLAGEESARPMGVKRSLEVQWKYLTREERNLLYNAMTERGSHGDIVLAVDADTTTAATVEVVLGRIKRAIQFPHTFTQGTAPDQLFGFSCLVSEAAPTEMT